MSDPIRGITCPDMRRVVRDAMKSGWEFVGWSGTTHAIIEWPKTGERLTFGSTPGVASWKTLATDIKRTSGVEVWRKGNRKKSRKTFHDIDPAVEAQRRKYQGRAEDRALERAGIRAEHQEREAMRSQLSEWYGLNADMVAARSSGDRARCVAATSRVQEVLRDFSMTPPQWNQLMKAIREQGLVNLP